MNTTEYTILAVAATVIAVFVLAMIAATNANAKLLGNALPKGVRSEQDYWCKAYIWPSRRSWHISGIAEEEQILKAMRSIARKYRGWIPEHYIHGMGHRAYWVIVLRKPSNKPVEPWDLTTWHGYPDPNIDQAICVGQNIHGKDVYIRNEHTLTVGVTGSGKSNLLANFVLEYYRAYLIGKVEYWAIDLKGGVTANLFKRQDGSSIFAQVAKTTDEALELLDKLNAVCAERQDYMTRKGLTQIPTTGTNAMPKIVLLIDEAIDLSKKAIEPLESILRRARALNIIVFAFTQNPRIEAFHARSYMPQRIALRLNSADEAKMTLGETAVTTGAMPENIAKSQVGAGYIYDEGAGRAVFFRSPYYEPEKLKNLI